MARGADVQEIICGRCWRTVDPKLRARYTALRKRSRQINRLARYKQFNGKPGFDRQIARLVVLFDDQWWRMWAAIKEDATIKSRMRVEGTAGELSARLGRTVA